MVFVFGKKCLPGRGFVKRASFCHKAAIDLEQEPRARVMWSLPNS